MASESMRRPRVGAVGAALVQVYVVGLLFGMVGHAVAGNYWPSGASVAASAESVQPALNQDMPALENQIDDALTAPPGIRRIQVALAGLGYALGRADGKLGRRTRAAIEQYQAASGIPSDGSITDRLYRSLHIVPPPPPEAVRLVQAKLTELGYGVGLVDGVAGPRTRRAIQTYQLIADMRADGEISFGLIDRLYGVVVAPARQSASRAEPATQAPVAALARPLARAGPVAPVALDPTVAPAAGTPVVIEAALVPPPVPTGVPSGLSGGLVTPAIKAVYEREIEPNRGAEPALLRAAELRGLYCEPDPDVVARGGRCQISWDDYLQGMRRFLDQTPR